MVGKANFDYSGESAIVTGSTKGIGRGIAEGLVEAGADVAVNARTKADVEETVEELRPQSSGDIIGVAADISDPENIERLVTRSIESFNEVPLLVNNAAVWPREESMVEAGLDDWDHAMVVNVRAQFYAAKLVAEHMIENDIEGNIINHTSQTGDRRTGGRGLYGLSNTAINGLTWRMAHDLAAHGIRMNAISTDVAETYQLRHEAELRAENDPDRTADDILREWGESRPLGRLGQSKDLADAVLFLASDRAGYIVGEILRVSGGGNLE
jgi:NAD(P)-dependent dehydrogenase (short-subunit alcohol dehydrogenase family)